MPQGATSVQVSVGSKTKLNISTQQVLKTAPGRVYRLIVVTAGSTNGTVSDAATVGAVAAANLIFEIPNTVGAYEINWPYFAGLIVTPGTGQVIAVNWS
jgi:hypothetical protein